jgi:hypothetical protein
MHRLCSMRVAILLHRLQCTTGASMWRRRLLSPSFGGEVELTRVLTRLPFSSRLPFVIRAASNLATPLLLSHFHLLPFLSTSSAVRHCKLTTLVLSVS